MSTNKKASPKQQKITVKVKIKTPMPTMSGRMDNTLKKLGKK